MRKIDKILILVAVLIVLFIISMEVCFFVFQMIPDTLCTCVLGAGLGELILTAIIKIYSDKHEPNLTLNEYGKITFDDLEGDSKG